jgi:NAD(P)-dependent dehydrogenase (short-subunit alcohol dehydrogenase family)
MSGLAIVTGGSRGIGKSISEALLNVGFNVYFTYKTDEVSANKIITRYGGKCQGFRVDGANFGEVKEFSEMVIKLNSQTPIVLINNLGINNDKLFLSQDIDDFWDVIKVNFGSVVNYSKCFVEHMIKSREGQIINISSIASVKPKIGNAAYGVSKSSIERFSKTLALEVARFNVRINCVSPGYVQTELFNNFLSKKPNNEFYRNIPMRKILKAEEVAALVKNLSINEIITTGSVFYIGNGENITI